MKATNSEFLWDMFEIGTAVIVDEGVFQGMRGTVLGVDHDELIVSMPLLSGIVPVTLDPTGVHIAEPLIMLPRVTH